MKKIVLGLFFFFVTLNSYALNESCFEYMGSSNIVQNEIFLVSSNVKLDYVKNSKGFIYNKLYKSGEKQLSYDIDLDSINKGIINDGKTSTSYDYLVGTKQNYDDVLILDFKKIVGPGIIPKISIDSINYYYTISISNDNFNYLDISINNLNTFSFRFIKVTFHSYNSYKLVENVKINDLIFKESYYTYLIKGNSGNNVFYYSNFYCSNDKDSGDFNNYSSINRNQDSKFFYKAGLKEFNLIMKKNLVYDIKKGVDTDGDLIDDEIDNCKTYYNPNQLDSNSNGIGDICDDDDNDGIIGIYDNCQYNSNKDQKDVNNNKVGDVCEFDKDKDGIFDSFDNCISTINKDQNDDDLDGIGNSCDNCSLYNPNQLDKNNNGVGDVCEESEKFNKENDKDFDSILDYNDNCKDVANKDQVDNDGDGVGDICDNCLNIKNFNQLDKNNNGVGDLCEDVDSDGFIGYLDNCSYQANADQKDSDNDGIGDVCEDIDNDGYIFAEDNCSYLFNIDQLDIDKDGIGDACDSKDNRFIESSKYFFIGMVLSVFIVFNLGIFFMFKKLKEIQKLNKK